eukprot:11560552-Alexandrium_andersonii.AAC.1
MTRSSPSFGLLLLSGIGVWAGMTGPRAHRPRCIRGRGTVGLAKPLASPPMLTRRTCTSRTTASP